MGHIMRHNLQYALEEEMNAKGRQIRYVERWFVGWMRREYSHVKSLAKKKEKKEREKSMEVYFR